MSEQYRARPDELSWREVEGEIILLDERDWTYLHLNGTGATIWKALADGGATLESVVAALTAEYDVDEPTAEADARALLDQLAERGLIEPAA